MSSKEEERAKRLATALRDNLRKRKAQSRTSPQENQQETQKIS
jgi:hypothetical protein